MYAALNEQDLLCRAFGACRHGAPLDRELGDLIDVAGGASRGIVPKLFTYVRYNTELSTQGLTELGLPNVDPKHVQKMDSVEYIAELQQVGQAAAKQINTAHFAGFVK